MSDDPDLPISPTTSIPMFDLAKWESDRKREAELTLTVLPQNKAALFGALAVAGIATVIVNFDGSGDSGQIEHMEARTADGTILKLPDDVITILLVRWGANEPEARTMKVTDAIEHLAYQLLHDTHLGWEINDGAYGEFEFIVRNQTITLDHNERFTDTQSYQHEW